MARLRTSRVYVCVWSGLTRARSPCALGRKKRRIESRRFRASLFIDIRLRLSEGIIYGFAGERTF